MKGNKDYRVVTTQSSRMVWWNEAYVGKWSRPRFGIYIHKCWKSIIIIIIFYPKGYPLIELASAHPPRWLEGMRLLLEKGADPNKFRDNTYPFYNLESYILFYFTIIYWCTSCSLCYRKRRKQSQFKSWEFGSNSHITWVWSYSSFAWLGMLLYYTVTYWKDW